MGNSELSGDSGSTDVSSIDPVLEYNIRAMTAADLERVLQIEHASYDIPWTQQIFKDCLKVGYYCLVMEGEAELLGYVIFSSAAGESHILNLCIDPIQRRQGFAEAMLSQAIATVIVTGAKVLFLEVRVSNSDAIALYEKLGFIETGRRENYYNARPRGPENTKTRNGGPANREDALLMAKELAI